MESILESIARQSASGRQKFTARNMDTGFSVYIDQHSQFDRQYIVDLCQTALSQIDARLYYGKLTSSQIERLQAYMVNYTETETEQ